MLALKSLLFSHQTTWPGCLVEASEAIKTDPVFFRDFARYFSLRLFPAFVKEDDEEEEAKGSPFFPLYPGRAVVGNEFK